MEKVDLTEAPEVLAALKTELDAPFVSTPTFRVAGELFVGMAHLRGIILGYN